MADDALFAGTLSRSLAPYGLPFSARTIEEAMRLRAPVGLWSGLLLDFCLPDGSGLNLLCALRAQGENGPAVVVSGRLTHEIVNQCFKVGARLLAKPLDAVDIRTFASESAEPVALCGEFRGIAESWAARYDLTNREAAVFEAALEGVPRDALADGWELRPETVDRHVRHLIQKSGDPRLSDAVARALRETLTGRLEAGRSGS